MIRAIVGKELRQLALILVLALGLYLSIVSVLTGLGPLANLRFVVARTQNVPFLDSQFAMSLALWTFLLAVVLGFRQSLGESRSGTYLFLLHRPCSRSAIFGTKLAVGVVAVLLLSALPILLYAWWAATPGNIPAPFEWSMTVPAWRLWASLPLLYLGAFLSGLRPAHWFGTRLLPLVGAIVAAMMYHAFGSLPWGLGFVYLALMYGLLLVAIRFVGDTRDYS
jgi:ABC-type transport system involved in multi-copper enzyme maturation permease subunit